MNSRSLIELCPVLIRVVAFVLIVLGSVYPHLVHVVVNMICSVLNEIGSCQGYKRCDLARGLTDIFSPDFFLK